MNNDGWNHDINELKKEIHEALTVMKDNPDPVSKENASRVISILNF